MQSNATKISSVSSAPFPEEAGHEHTEGNAAAARLDRLGQHLAAKDRSGPAPPDRRGNLKKVRTQEHLETRAVYALCYRQAVASVPLAPIAGARGCRVVGSSSTQAVRARFPGSW